MRMDRGPRALMKSNTGGDPCRCNSNPPPPSLPPSHAAGDSMGAVTMQRQSPPVMEDEVVGGVVGSVQIHRWRIRIWLVRGG